MQRVVSFQYEEDRRVASRKNSPLAGDVQIDVLALVVDHDANVGLCNSTIAEGASFGGQKLCIASH